MAAYDELDEFVGELRDDLRPEDELLLVSDHGLQQGVHTHEAMVAATDPSLVESIDGVLDVRDAIETELDLGNHETADQKSEPIDSEGGEQVQERLEDLGYM